MAIVESHHTTSTQCKTTHEFRDEFWAYIKNPTYELAYLSLNDSVWLRVWRMFKAIFLLVFASGILATQIVLPIEKIVGVNLTIVRHFMEIL